MTTRGGAMEGDLPTTEAAVDEKTQHLSAKRERAEEDNEAVTSTDKYLSTSELSDKPAKGQLRQPSRGHETSRELQEAEDSPREEEEEHTGREELKVEGPVYNTSLPFLRHGHRREIWHEEAVPKNTVKKSAK